ncbi:MAG: DnaJ domain-containing protein [Woeseia sp.]|nr:DnaJ domain-containing protein [Woeseia sp.]NNE60562.1 DnaJ domain-containing protein [Woeseia sp.]
MPTSNRNYYDILHVSRDAPRAIIQVSYRTLMQKLKCHPDLGGDAGNASLINKAYAVLNDIEKRAEYDAQLNILDGVGRNFDADSPQAGATTGPGKEGADVTVCVFCSQPHKLGSVIAEDAVCETCRSPLCAAQATRTESAGKRAVERLEKHRGLRFYTEWPLHQAHSGETRDISLNGLSFVTRQNLREGQRIKIASAVLEAVAVVTHCSAEKTFWARHCVVGVSFLTLRFVNQVGGFVSEQV